MAPPIEEVRGQKPAVRPDGATRHQPYREGGHRALGLTAP